MFWMMSHVSHPLKKWIGTGTWNLALRATSHTSQEPWPCNGEDPWLSSKGRTMGVGIAVLGSHRPSSIVWSENGPCCRTIAYFVGGKGREDLVSYIMSQNLPIWKNYLVVFVYPIIYYGTCPKICLYEDILKNHGLSKYASGPPLGGRHDENSGRP